MPQVEVDEPSVQKQLGQIQMDYVKKVEKLNLARANEHRRIRRGDWFIGGLCCAIAVGIYAYTIYGMRQETFLEDFELPDPMEGEPQKKK